MMLVDVKPPMLVGGIKIAVVLKTRLQSEHGTDERWGCVTFPLWFLAVSQIMFVIQITPRDRSANACNPHNGQSFQEFGALHANALCFPGDLSLKNLGDVSVGEVTLTTVLFFLLSSGVILGSRYV